MGGEREKKLTGAGVGRRREKDMQRGKKEKE
ncbi:Protein CBG27708 [Caenorhabditis briggsae]|uniref:Protein CBG27708 n=1 Tax=Caenorhabditis briggsae TaxID=6238 RepID=B6IJ07_CAEBR|nr:Protein CBG27708 [Caenorhabditis briggsae]CAR99987.1 Protein CBG27708 [Caenorhabditis briggsae]